MIHRNKSEKKTPRFADADLSLFWFPKVYP